MIHRITLRGKNLKRALAQRQAAQPPALNLKKERRDCFKSFVSSIFSVVMIQLPDSCEFVLYFYPGKSTVLLDMIFRDNEFLFVTMTL
ncbi:MAG TPA: hypothetical protein VNN22_06730 [Verrucomicrobiae bacterium]|nr:hypothetical protein [Verrucomicrobiae bacterium]